jgi:ligand-binding SRPBCC domain-containing protein
MKTFWFQTETLLKTSLTDVFKFFSNAENLETITPPWLKFNIITPLPIEMRKGAVIDYQLKLYGIPLKWKTLILEWDPPFRFIDCQLNGPYKKWIHEHRFEEKGQEIHMIDSIEYALPGGILAPAINSIKIKKDINKIFLYREKKIIEIFKPI